MSWLLPSAFITGEIRMWGGTIANIPRGWMHLDGSAISRATYAALFAIMGTIYGVGNGTTTFNLPDFRDRFPVGAKQDSSGVPKTNISGGLTQTGGAATGSFTFSGTTSQGDLVINRGNTGTQSAVTSSLHVHTFSGATDSASILNPYVAGVYMIKT